MFFFYSEKENKTEIKNQTNPVGFISEDYMWTVAKWKNDMLHLPKIWIYLKAVISRCPNTMWLSRENEKLMLFEQRVEIFCRAPVETNTDDCKCCCLIKIQNGNTLTPKDPFVPVPPAYLRIHRW